MTASNALPACSNASVYLGASGRRPGCSPLRCQQWAHPETFWILLIAQESGLGVQPLHNTPLPQDHLRGSPGQLRQTATPPAREPWTFRHIDLECGAPAW